ncbi:MAG TPA: endolytic transglycosylase MltG [Actinomycetes bacterium]|nr:endolytic transglycosylase MltG [Actinomycetes bacterium]
MVAQAELAAEGPHGPGDVGVGADQPAIAHEHGVDRAQLVGRPLEVDATVQYAVGHTRLTARDLRSRSPYNTYVHAGLPPTPIAAPGEAAIKAALQPADGDWIYYVLASKDGEHAFTSSYQEFLRLKSEARAKGLL